MAFEGLGSPQPPFGFPPPSFPSPPIPNPNPKPAARQQRTPPQPKRRSVSPHSWSNQRKHPVHLAYPTNHERLPPVTAVVAHGAEAKFPTKTINFHAPERNQSPTWPSPDDFQNNYHSSDAITERLRTQTDVPFENGTSEQSKRMRSSPLAFESNHFDMNLISSHKESQRSDISPLRLSTQRNYPTNIGNSPPHQRFHPIDYSDIYDSGKFSPPKPAYFNALERASSPPLPSANVSLGTRSVRLDPERPLVSPPRLASKKTFPINVTNSPSHRSSRPLDDSDIYDVGTISPPKPTYFSSPKRGRSPPLASANVSLGTSSDQHDIEREKKAKVKRLARFNVELSQPMENVHEFMRHKSSEVKHNQAPLDKKNPDSGAEVAQDLVTRGILSDDEGLGSSQVVVGLCPDMCPESERQERERKGDLDKFERLDGERNHTSKLLAVKKYTRTAEREADLIRPMPVLQKTVDYLLQLLDLPYNDNFLGIYNFLWDRMRAIRMDLRMQHIFNYEAIVMLEQMIRLHIIAMHELCEYKKGEGFSEGFDAHLNIEQMNKTSVELFQMYDDHRKKGNSVQTEKEFRGYYALLKLDKHPGYRVEPAELSHELARMTPEIRCTSELLFARDVARACRIGNYIAFFRLAKKATYLQACLMHAHFAKVRRKALASLHSGLQHNQGIPISHVVKWLGMEEEDIESLLEYHGFAVKNFEEVYMVKEGPFLNIDTDFPTKCSQLVHFQRPRRIIDDVYSGRTLSEASVEKETELDIINHRRTETSDILAQINLTEEEMLDYKEDSFLGVGTPTEQLVEGSSPAILNRENVDENTQVSVFECSYVSLDDSSSIHAHQVDEGHMSQSDGYVFINEGTLPKLEGSISKAGIPSVSNSNGRIENFSPRALGSRSLGYEALVSEHNQDETFNEKLIMIIRKWKQRASLLREIREQREFLAAAALSSLSLGPPIRQNKSPPKPAIEELNIDYVARERHGRQEKSWSGLNVSELVAPILIARNHDARCICWKLSVFVQASGNQNPTIQLASRWLLTKLRGKENDDGLVVSLPQLSIWKKWTGTHISDPQTCCLSVIREAMIDGNQPIFDGGVLTGTSCIMFVVSETVPWEIQRFRLHSILMAVPSGSRLPLLVVSIDSCKEEITSRLGLHDTDRTRIEAFSVVFLGQLNGFYNDNELREGLQWLANHSPVQPAVHKVNIRELVLSYLRCATDALSNLNDSEIGPDQCISVFNEALDQVAEEIMSAASMNLNQWPCPTIDLLPERKSADMSLPNAGWSSTGTVEPLIRVINTSKLASFPSYVVGGQIHNQKQALEECLTSYLIRLGSSIHGDLAAAEARVMVQRGCVLELKGSCYHVVPRWLVIFWRIYNWQLTKLNDAEGYVLEELDRLVTMGSPSMNGAGSLWKMIGLSLDEMVEASCSVELALQPPPSVGSPECFDRVIVHENGRNSDMNDSCKADGALVLASSTAADHDDDISRLVERRKEKSLTPLSEKNDRLALLLEQCKLTQDKIDEKLAVYF